MLTALVVVMLAQQSQPGYPPSRERIYRSRFEFGATAPAAAIPTPPLTSQFAFADVTGTGMTAECAGTALTDKAGDAVVFARASDAYCTIGNENSGITNSSLVLLTTDQPRVMKGGDGSGFVGLMMEPAITNAFTYSQQFGAGTDWNVFGFTSAAPTVTNNYAVAPDGTTTADRVQVPAVTGVGTEVSVVYQNGRPAGVQSYGLYLKGTSGSGTTYIMYGNTPGTSATMTCLSCDYNATTWTRCKAENITITGAGEFYIGADSNGLCPAAAHAASDVLIWQADNQNQARLTAPVVSVAVAGTRAAETAYIAAGSLSWTTVHLSAQMVLGSMLATYVPYQLYIDSSNYSSGFLGSTTGVTPAIFTTRLRYAGTSNNTNSAALAAANSTATLGSYYASSVRGSCVGSACLTTAGALTVPSGTYKLYIGSRGDTAGVANGVVKNLCADPTSCPGAP